MYVAVRRLCFLSLAAGLRCLHEVTRTQSMFIFSFHSAAVHISPYCLFYIITFTLHSHQLLHYELLL